jgi:fatty acid synthase subunit beta
LIGLTQIAQYLVTARALDFEPDAFRDRLKGATGHSQGVVTAAVIAMSTGAKGWDGFVENALEGLKVLFFIGLLGCVPSLLTVSLHPS